MPLGDISLGGDDLGGSAQLHATAPQVSCAVGVPVYGPEVTVQPDGRAVLDVFLEATTWAVDATKALTFGLQQSDDGGGSWRHLVSGTTTSGELAKGGILPWVGITVTVATLVRPFLEATGSASLTAGAVVIAKVEN